MKTKLLAMILLAGGSMFAQTRFSIGVSFGGHGDGFYEPPSSYIGPRFDNHFNDGDDRQSFARGFEQDRSRTIGQRPGYNTQERYQTHGFNQGVARESQENQNRWDSNRSDEHVNHQGKNYATGFRGR